MKFVSNMTYLWIGMIFAGFDRAEKSKLVKEISNKMMAILENIDRNEAKEF